METIRTPDERFEKLTGFDFEPHYSEVPDGEGGSLRIHRVDMGPRDGEVILCLHGQPTWSFLYRKMIPPFVAAGHRVVAPDFVGFGRSDKPVRRQDYTYSSHVDWMTAWLDDLDLRDVTLFCQDWGGLVGLRIVAQRPERFARIIAANTALPDGSLVPDDAGPAMRKLYDTIPVVDIREVGRRFASKDGPPGFFYWRRHCSDTPDLRIGELMAGVGASLSPEVVAGYDAPFPDERSVAGARQFPSLVPIFPDDPEIPKNRAAWKLLEGFDRPFLTAFSDGDPVTRGAEKSFEERVPGAHGQRHVTIRGAGHFLQEDKGEEVAAEVLRFIADNPLPGRSSECE